MEGEYRIRKITMQTFFALLIVSFFFSMTKYTGSLENKKSGLPDCISIDSINSGDLICRLGNGYFSDVFRQFSGGKKRFSHIGIAHFQDSLCYVIHAEASEFTGQGGVRMDMLDKFIEHSLDYQFFHITSDSIRQRIDSLAYEYFKMGIQFDLCFDLTSDTTLYCTELVANCINKAMGNPDYIPTYSLSPDFKCYRISDILESNLIR